MIEISTEIVKICLIMFILCLITFAIKTKTTTNEHMIADQTNLSPFDDIEPNTSKTRQNDFATKQKVKKTIFKVFIKQLKDQNKFNKDYMNFKSNYFEYLSNEPTNEITTNRKKGLYETLLALEDMNANAKEENLRCKKIKQAYSHSKATYNEYEKGLDLCFDVEYPIPVRYIFQIYGILFDMLFERVLRANNVISIDFYNSLLNTAEVTDDYNFVQDVNTTELFNLSKFDVTHPQHDEFKKQFKRYLVDIVGTQLSIIETEMNSRQLQKQKLLYQRSESTKHTNFVSISKNEQRNVIDFSGNIDYTKIIF